MANKTTTKEILITLGLITGAVVIVWGGTVLMGKMTDKYYERKSKRESE